MTLPEAITAALWLLWGLGWTLLAWGVKPDLRADGGIARTVHLGPLVLAGLLLGMRHVPWKALETRLPGAGPGMAWVGTGFVALGALVALWARGHLGREWSGFVVIKVGHALVRSGPYAYVRHPIYTGLLLAVLGSALVRGEVRGLVALVFAATALIYKLRREEAWLGERFGEAYTRYRDEVPALLPWRLGKRSGPIKPE